MRTRRSSRWLAWLLACLPVVAAAQDVRAQEEGRLRSAATDTSLNAGARVAALDRLANLNSNAASDLSVSLKADASEPVALAAVKLLSDAIVMSDHGPVDPSRLTEQQRQLLERHRRYTEALYPVLTDARPALRKEAARILASLGQTRALDIINDGVSRGLYADWEAANYFGLAGVDKGGGYLERYLDGRSARATVAAVEYLGRSPRYQNAVQSRVLRDRTKGIEPRVTAARVLGEHDKTFTSYAPDLLASTELPGEVYAEVASKLIERNPRLAPGQIDAISRTLQDYQRGSRPPDLRRLQEFLNRARG